MKVSVFIIGFVAMLAISLYFASAWYNSEAAQFEREQVVSTKWHKEKQLRKIFIEIAKSKNKSELVEAINRVRDSDSPSIPIVESSSEVKYSGLKFSFNGNTLSSISTDDDRFFEP